MFSRRTRSLAVLAVLAVLAPAGRADESFDELQEKAIKEAVRTVAPCVVQIETSGGTDVVRVGPRGMIRRGNGPTSGLVVAEDGFIISSAFNFINKPAGIRIAVPGQKERFVARVIATDQTRMLTLLKIDLPPGQKLPVPVPAPKAGVKIGHTALAVGRTLSATADQPPSVSVGIISALDRIWGKAVQTDAKVSPTNYGGPLADLQGRVIGVLVPASPRAEGETAGFEWYDSGIGFAIPLEDVNRALPRLKQGKDLRRGLLGITMQGQDMYGVAPTIGTVAPGSAAEKHGLRPGDVIKEIDGKPVHSHAQLQHRLGTRYEGDAVAVKVQRGKDEVAVPGIVLSGAVAAFGPTFLGILPVRDDPAPGVEVRYVYPKSAADKAGLKEGDRILKVGRQVAPGRKVTQPVSGRDQLMSLLEALRPGTALDVEVRRKDGKKTETLKVTLGEMPDAIPAKLPERATARKAKKGEKEAKKPETGLLKRTTPAADHSYWVYVPENYDHNVAHALVVWLHPSGRNKDRDVDDLTWAWQDFCEDNHIILVGPKTDSERGWTPGESDFVQEAVRGVLANYNVDRRRVVAHGMGLGGEMAYYLGFHARPLVRGVAVVGAPLTSNPKERVVNQPLSFFLVAGGRDPLKDGIKGTRDKLAEHRYPVILREIADLGHQYIDGRAGQPTLEELVRWIDSLDRL